MSYARLVTQIKNPVSTRRIRCFSAPLVTGEVWWRIWMDLTRCEHVISETILLVFLMVKDLKSLLKFTFSHVLLLFICRCKNCKGKGMIPCATCGSRGLIKCETCQGGGSLLTRKVAVVRWYVLTRFKYIHSWSDNVVNIDLG